MEILSYPQKAEKPTAVALGFFDGVHMAHRQIIGLAVSQKDMGLTPAVFTFAELPQKSPTGLLTDNSEKQGIFKNLGVELLCLCDFDAVKTFTPREFVEKVLSNTLHAEAVVCGYNFRFGKEAKGDTETLKALCKEFGIKLFVLDEVFSGNTQVSSSNIKKLLKDGELKEANRLLKEDYSFEGKVIHGKKIGRKMGKPTLNIELCPQKFLPRFGVYACEVSLSGTLYKAVANIGVKPTVTGENIPTLEAFLIDAEGDFYGDTARVSLVEFLRDEKKFESIAELQKTIEADTEKAKEILKNSSF
ncbi:MAG: bifunctional riboflavin kinase/FAD synthetase [Eubacteriales bacterium]|nr:bifunctional riboflavin kinase/FAD synthetase [Eubacteriales bacterium]